MGHIQFSRTTYPRIIILVAIDGDIGKILSDSGSIVFVMLGIKVLDVASELDRIVCGMSTLEVLDVWNGKIA